MIVIWIILVRLNLALGNSKTDPHPVIREIYLPVSPLDVFEGKNSLNAKARTRTVLLAK